VSLKERVARGETLIGGYVESTAPQLVEIAGHVGFDYVVLSSEDSIYDVRDWSEIVYAAEAVGLPTICRPPSNDPVFIRRALDMGMKGLNVPMVNTAEDARKVVRAALYPPAGTRGLNAMSRPVRYGADFGPEFFERGNADILVTVIIETATAVENIEEIVAVEGIDLVYIGPTDLSISLGLPGDVFHPRVVECANRIRAAASKKGVATGHVIYDPLNREEIERRMEEGHGMLSVFHDIQLFRLACERLHESVRAS
jgi:4-hydroxy-2-oxoheptanedioate aldolase